MKKYFHWLLLAAVAVLLVAWLLLTPPGLLGKADAVGYAVCHRIDIRSFHLGERQLPLCARCTGMYLGAVLGLAYQGIFSRRRGGLPPRRLLPLLGLLALAFALDGANSFLSLFPFLPGLYSPNNTLRLLTGTGMGLVVAAFIYPAFNQTVWQDWDARPALAGLRSFGRLVLLALLLDLLVLPENPLLLYPLALLSAAGVILLLTLIYSMAWLMALHLDNHYTAWAQLRLPLAGGFGIALLQIALLNLVRYLLTGTWDGFHF